MNFIGGARWLYRWTEMDFIGWARLTSWLGLDDFMGQAR